MKKTLIVTLIAGLAIITIIIMGNTQKFSLFSDSKGGHDNLKASTKHDHDGHEEISSTEHDHDENKETS